MDNSKFIWPVTVVLSSTILAGSFYFVQQNKAISIEKQRNFEIFENHKNKLG